MKRRREGYSAAELEHGELLWEHLHALPAEPPPAGPSDHKRRLYAGAARLLVMWALGANSRAMTLDELEIEATRRIESLAGADLSYNVHALRRALFVAFGAAAARWGDRRAGVAPTATPPSLPPWVEEQPWQRAVAAYLDRNAAQHEQVLAALGRGVAFAAARAQVAVQGRRALLRTLMALALPAADARSMAEDARRPYPHFCRCCGDADCRSHCRRSILGEHLAPPGERACSRCRLDADASSGWSAVDGCPATWAAPPPLTPEEEAFERAFEAMIHMTAQEQRS